MKQSFFIILLFVIFSLLSANVTIGSGNDPNQSLPTDPYWGYSYSQMIYLQNEIQATGNITGIRFHYTITSTNFLERNAAFVVYMGHTSNTTFTGSNSWLPINSLTTVYNGTITANDLSSSLPGEGWLSINFSTPFNYNNVDNLVIAVEENTPDFSASTDDFYSTDMTTNRSIEFHNDNTNPNPASPPEGSLKQAIANVVLLGITSTVPPSIPSQPTPTDNQTDLSIYPSLNWYSNGDSYSVYMGTNNQTPTLVSSNIPMNTYQVNTPLQYSTQYSWYVVASNVNGSVTGPTWHFVTEPDPTINVPHLEDFSADSYPPTNWKIKYGLLQESSTLSDYAGGWFASPFGNNSQSPNGMSSRIDVWSTNVQTWLETPPIQVPTNQPIQLEFDLALTHYGTQTADVMDSDDKFAIVYSPDNGLTWSSDNILRMWNQSTPISNIGEHVVIPLNTLAGVIKLGFYAESTQSGADNDVFVDNVFLRPIPTVPLLAALPDSINYGTVTFGQPVTRQIELRNIGLGALTISSAPALSGVNANQYLISDSNVYPLILNTNQGIFINATFNPTSANLQQAVINVNDNQRTLTTIQLAGTGYDPVLYPGFTETFNSTQFPPREWHRYSGLLAEQTTLTPIDSGWNSSVFANDYSTNNACAHVDIWNTSCDYWLVTPPINVGTSNNNRLEFDLALTMYGNQNASTLGDDDKFGVIVSTDGINWSSDNVLRIWNSQTPINASGERIMLPLTSYAGNVWIAFYGESTQYNADNDVFVDNVSVKPIPTTPVFYITPQAADYSSVNLAEYKDVTFDIRNYGIGTLTINTPITFTGTSASDFSVASAVNYPINIIENASFSFNVRFAPTVAGNKTATMHITDTLTRIQHDIQLVGIAHDPVIIAPYLQDFGSDFPPLDWTLFTGELTVNSALTAATYSWTSVPYLNDYMNINLSAEATLSGTSSYNWLVTPSINLGTGGQDYRIGFDLALTRANMDTEVSMDEDDHFDVVISTDNGITWTSANILRDWDESDYISSTGNHQYISLQNYTGIVKIGFYAQSTVNNVNSNLFVDNFTIEPIPTMAVASYSADSLNYGNVLFNHQRTKKISITNIGGTAFTITSANIAGENATSYIFSPAITQPLQVAPGAVQEIAVTVDSTVLGTKTAQLTITNSLTRTQKIIALRANVMQADGDNAPENAIQLSLPVNGLVYSIQPESDIDWYKFYLNVNDSILAHTERTNGSQLDPEFYLYGPSTQDGTSIVETQYITNNDDGYGDLQPEIEYQATEAGWYFLRVAHYTMDPVAATREIKQRTREVTGDYALYITSAAVVNLYPPQNLEATVNGAVVTLTWEAPAQNTILRNAWSLVSSKGKRNNREFIGYKVYRNQICIQATPINALTYIDTLASGDYTYYVTALYTDGESNPSNSVDVNILVLNAPQNLIATINYPTNVVLAWQAPQASRQAISTRDRSLIGYKVYRNNIPLATISSSTRTYTDGTVQNNQTYQYYVTAIYTEGVSGPSNVVTVLFNANDPDIIPINCLYANYPNPFNPSTTIQFALEKKTQTVISIYNVKGQRIRTLWNGLCEVGSHSLIWDGTNDKQQIIPSGIYLLEMRAGSYHSVKRMILMK